MTPQEYCQNKAASSGSSFYYSFLFLPTEQRQAIIALYAFCREVDDVVDECSSEEIAQTKLEWWRKEIANLFDGKPNHPVTKALEPCIESFNLPMEHFIEVIDGMQMDLEYNSYPSFKELSLYCHRVASIVGLMSVEIFGFENRKTLKYAHDLGMAFQLTNILRDVREDAERGRIYLPLDELEKFDVSVDDVLSLKNTDNMRKLFAFQAERAREYYRRAYSHLPDEDRYRQVSGLIMSAIYEATLTEIEKDDFQVMKQRIRLTPLRKLWIAWKTYRGERKRHKRLRLSLTSS